MEDREVINILQVYSLNIAMKSVCVSLGLLYPIKSGYVYFCVLHGGKYENGLKKFQPDQHMFDG